MSQDRIDQVAAIKASLEMMVTENAEIHEYFRDLLEKVADLETQEPEARREKFKDLVSMGAFRFNGLDIRHFTHSQRRPLSPPLFLSRTKRRLKNTQTLVDGFEQRGIFPESEQLRAELEMLASTILDENNGKEVLGFKAKVDELRESSLFQSYQATKNQFIRQDAEVRADAQFLAAKETVEEGEELLRQRAEDLDSLGQEIDDGSMALEEAQARLDSMALEAEPPPAPQPAGEDAGASEVAGPTDAGADDDGLDSEFDALSADVAGEAGDELDALIDGLEEGKPA